MKNKKFSKKLTFKKMTVADLTSKNMQDLKGGIRPKTDHCVYTVDYLPCTAVFTCAPTCTPTWCGGICVG